MFIKLLVLFTIVPVVELFLLIKVGQHIGTMNTIALIILTGIIGASFARSQGAQILYQIHSTVNQGHLPGKELLQGAMILAGGILLITPGFITDLVGFSLLFPLTRQFYTDMALNYIKRKFQGGHWHVTTYPGTTYTHPGDDENRHPQDDD